MRVKRKALAGTLEVLRQSQQEAKPYWVQVAGQKFKVLPGVFSPKYFNDTEFFAQTLPFEAGKTFLEMGPGCGALTILAALKGMESVAAVDINPLAVDNTLDNVEWYGLHRRVTVYYGSLFEPLPRGMRYDQIFWNTPFAFTANQELTPLERAVIDPGYEVTERFVREAEQHLAPGGRLLIGYSTTLGHFGWLRQLLRECGYAVRKMAEVDSTESTPVKFQLFEAKLRTK